MKNQKFLWPLSAGREIESFFDAFPLTSKASPSFKVNISQDEKNVLVKAEIPGVDKKDIKAQVLGDNIKISFEKKNEREEKNKNGYFMKESSFGFFSRVLTLGAQVMADKAKATYKDGVLKIVLPKKNPQENRIIKVD